MFCIHISQLLPDLWRLLTKSGYFFSCFQRGQCFGDVHLGIYCTVCGINMYKYSILLHCICMCLNVYSIHFNTASRLANMFAHYTDVGDVRQTVGSPAKHTIICLAEHAALAQATSSYSLQVSEPKVGHMSTAGSQTDRQTDRQTDTHTHTFTYAEYIRIHTQVRLKYQPAIFTAFVAFYYTCQTSDTVMIHAILLSGSRTQNCLAQCLCCHFSITLAASALFRL